MDQSQPLLSFQNGRIVLDHIATRAIDGDVVLTGDLDITGSVNIADNVNFKKDVIVDGAIEATSIRVKEMIANIVYETQNPITFSGNTALDLTGKGFEWVSGDRVRHFVFKNEAVFSDIDLDLHRSNSYKIDRTTVLSASELGPTVTKSNLRELGRLKSLEVLGRVSIGQFATFDEVFNRLGINTENPNGTFSVVDNGSEFIIGSRENDVIHIGTFSGDDLNIVTDNITRLTVSRAGEITVGNAKFRDGIFRVNGKIYADEIISDTSHAEPITFKALGKGNEPYGTGLKWSGSREFTLQGNTDRLFSSEIIDLAREKYYSIDNTMVLGKNTLGPTVVHSNLVTLGVLQDLTVSGMAKFMGGFQSKTRTSTVTVEDGLIFTDSNNSIKFTSRAIETTDSFKIKCDGEDELSIDSDGSIVIGNSHNTNRRVAVFGQLSVGVQNPDPGVSFMTVGSISFANKKFEVGNGAPTAGRYNKGDIVWNSEPQDHSYVGWVCVVAGTPGQWQPFGAIGRQ